MRLDAMFTLFRRALAAAALGLLAPVAAFAAFAGVSHTTALVNGVRCDVWTWTDSTGHPRTVALKLEGHGNPGHGGYAVQMTYYAHDYPPYEKRGGTWRQVIVNAPKEYDGGFGYFVSHERYRYFTDGTGDTIAHKIFNGADDAPLGLTFPVTTSVDATAEAGSESFTLIYPHYGTKLPGGYDAKTGRDNPPLGLNPAGYALYKIPVTTTWVFQSGMDFPRIDVSLDMARITAPGTETPTAGLVSFDLRGPYGVMIFDDGANGAVTTAEWGDRQFTFAPLHTPITRGSPWNWSAANYGARYNVIATGSWPGTMYEMGLFEPVTAANSALADGYDPERGYTSASYAALPGHQPSTDMCGDPQTLPTDAYWPYQSVQYSLPCKSVTPDYLNAPASGKKISWGSTALYGFNLDSVYNGRQSFPINGFPRRLDYSVCLVLGRIKWPPFGGEVKGAPSLPLLTVAQAALYTSENPKPANANCATATVGEARRSD